MSNSSYTFKDNSKQILDAMENAKHRGLEAVGMRAEKHAKDVLNAEVYSVPEAEQKERGYRLTGRLRNSVTYAISGEQAKTTEYSDETKTTYHYQGQAPDDKDKSVYIGTNVEYAAGIELGTHRRKGPVHFLQKAAQDHKDEYKQLLKDSMENA